MIKLYAERETGSKQVAEVFTRGTAKRLADDDILWPEGCDAVLVFEDGHRETLNPDGKWVVDPACEKCGSTDNVTLVKVGQTLELCDKCKPDFVACDYPGGRDKEPFRTRVTVTYPESGQGKALETGAIIRSWSPRKVLLTLDTHPDEVFSYSRDAMTGPWKSGDGTEEGIVIS